LDFLDNPDQVCGISQITIMQDEISVINMRILIQVIYALGIEQGAAAFDAMDFISFAQEQFREIRSVLSGDTCD
jgi:hypothetical protein